MIRFPATTTVPAIAILASATLAGCAHTTGTQTVSAVPLPGTEQCLFTTQVRGWKVLDQSTLLVDAPTGSSAYLFKLFAPVTGLQFQETLAFIDGDHNGQLCGNGDSLAIAGPMAQQVPITAVRLLGKEEAAALRTPAAKAGVAPKAASP